MESSLNSLDLSDALVLTGPTASGKSALAARIAKECQAEVIALDSMTLYRGMDIGTAKPTFAERRATPYHLIDVLNPWENASVAWWLERAESAARDIRKRGKRVLFVGGTALYLKALLCGIFDGPGASDQVRERLEAEASSAGGKEILFERLRQVDPPTALRLHTNDMRRVIRALEVWEATGRPLSSWQGQWNDQEANARVRPAVFWLDLPRSMLHERINARVTTMFDSGWIDEAKALRQLGRPLSATASQALGYREIGMYLDGIYTPEQAKERIQACTRQFAKRQITWFRHLPGCKPIAKELTCDAWNLKLEVS
ncbi:MAG TPA: tRNA (adenosine(37)-N6)-dimethylallyltransferase MiaA [Gemmataceae bacterium]|nr:tRNA (adenosine(37)-N6)-dimethylallyltransferase MiaA [Gemmataceae bacterium]